jgi:hypothetical protein
MSSSVLLGLLLPWLIVRMESPNRTQRTTTRNDDDETPTLRPMEARKTYQVSCLPSIIPTLAAQRARGHGCGLNRYLEGLVLEEAGKGDLPLTQPVFVEAAAIAQVGGLLSTALGALEKADYAETERLILVARRECMTLFKTLQESVAQATEVRSKLRYLEGGGEGDLDDEYAGQELYEHVED